MLGAIRKKDPQLMALAATNLSFLYLLEHETEKAEHYAQLAVQSDKYSAQAMVNRGNCFFLAGQLGAAHDSYLEAIGVQADCIEALYNLGLTAKAMRNLDDALLVFRKLQELVPKSPEVVYELADCWQEKGDMVRAIEALHQLMNLVHADPNIWARIAAIWDQDGNEEQAFQCYLESYNLCPSDLDVVTWLGAYWRDRRGYEQALRYFERAIALVPKEPRYLLMAASCWRQMDCKQEALDLYEQALRLDPLNRQALDCLVKLCEAMGLGAKAEHYNRQLRDLNERIRQAEEEERSRREAAAPPGEMKGQTRGFEREEPAQAPALRFEAAEAGDVRTVQAGGGKGVWDDVDVDL